MREWSKLPHRGQGLAVVSFFSDVATEFLMCENEVWPETRYFFGNRTEEMIQSGKLLNFASFMATSWSGCYNFTQSSTHSPCNSCLVGRSIFHLPVPEFIHNKRHISSFFCGGSSHFTLLSLLSWLSINAWFSHVFRTKYLIVSWMPDVPIAFFPVRWITMYRSWQERLGGKDGLLHVSLP